MKRVLSMLIAAIMVVSMMPAMTFMSLAEEPMGVPGQVYVDTTVDSTWHSVGPETPVQAIGTNGAYSGSYDPIYNNASVMGVIFEVAGVDSAITLSTNSFKAGVSNNTTGVEVTSQIYKGYDKKKAGGDSISADGIYVYLAQPMWWSQWKGMLFCTSLKDVSFVTSANCSMRILGILEAPQLETAESDRSTYVANLSSEIKFVDTDKTTELGTQSSTIATGWEHGWGGSIVKKLDAISTEYAPEPTQDEENKYEFDGWKTVDTDASVTYAAGQFTVYPTIKTTSLSSVTVTFKNGAAVADVQSVAPGSLVVYGGATPEKAEDADKTYVFRGWKDENGELVDLATYTTDVDATLTADFVAVAKTKASLVVKEALSFNKAGTYGIKLNRTDITVDALAGTTAPITGGTVTVSSSAFTNADGEKTFDVTFDSVDETGLTNAEFTLLPPAGNAGTHSVTLSGTVTGEASAKVYATTENIEVAGQQVGQYYGEDAPVVALNKNNGDTPPAAQTVWSDNVSFGSAQRGITFVMKATGIETPVELVRIDTGFVNAKGANDNFSWHWFYNNPFWGSATTSSRSLAIAKDGYYLLYIDNRLFDGQKVTGAKSFSVFTNDGSAHKDDPTKVNNNENAALQMVAVVGGNLQPTVTFHKEDGSVVSTYQHKYTNVTGTTNSGNEARQSMSLITVGKAVSASNVVAPVKDPDEENTYTFAGWTDKDGNTVDADALYMNVDLYPKYTATPKTTSYTVKFMNGEEGFDSQQVWENGYAAVPEGTPVKADDATGTFTFEGWSLDGTNVIAPESVVITENTTFVAVYTHKNVEFTVTYMHDDKVFYTETVVRSLDAAYAGVPTIDTDAYVDEETTVYYHKFEKWVDAEGVDAVLTNVQDNVTVYAQFVDVPVDTWYTVNWLDKDGTVLSSKKVAAGDGTATSVTGAFNGKGDENYWYSFSGWDKETTAINADTDVSIVYSTTDVNTSSILTSYTVTGKVVDKTMLFSSEVGTYKWAESGIHDFSLLVKIEGASEENPVTLGGMRTNIGGIDSNNSGNYGTSSVLFNAVTEDGYYYANIGGYLLTWVSSDVMNSLAFSDPNATRGGVSADASGAATFTATFIPQFFTPEVRFYGKDGQWLATNRITTAAGNWSYDRVKAPTPASLYNGADLGEDFLYWADAEGNEVTQLYDSMDVYAVYEKDDVLYGDVNGDEVITSSDVTALSRYVAGWGEGYEIGPKA